MMPITPNSLPTTEPAIHSRPNSKARPEEKFSNLFEVARQGHEVSLEESQPERPDELPSQSPDTPLAPLTGTKAETLESLVMAEPEASEADPEAISVSPSSDLLLVAPMLTVPVTTPFNDHASRVSQQAPSPRRAHQQDMAYKTDHTADRDTAFVAAQRDRKDSLVPVSAALPQQALMPRHQSSERVNKSVTPTSQREATAIKSVVQSGSHALQATEEPHDFVAHLNQSLAIAQQMQSRTADQTSGGQYTQHHDAEHQISLTSTTPSQTVSVSNPQGQATSAAFYAIDVTLNHDGWSKAMSQQVINFMKNLSTGDHVAQMRLDPPDLGPLRVELRIDEMGIAQALFTASNAQVRQMLEQAMPELQRNMNAAGLTLAHADVEDRSYNSEPGQHDQGHRDTRSMVSLPLTDSGTTTESVKRPPSQHLGQINTFA